MAGRSDQRTLSLDIPYNRIPEWLASRDRLPSQWLFLLKGIEAYVEKACALPPPADSAAADYISKSKDAWNYWKVHQLMELLAQGSESKEKNFLGQQNSIYIVKWREIIKIYQKKNLYLADLAKTLTQYVGYDIPSYKKSIEQINKKISDIRKRQQELKKTEGGARHRFSQFRSRYSIEEGLSSDSLQECIHVYVEAAFPCIIQEILYLSQEFYDSIEALFKRFHGWTAKFLQKSEEIHQQKKNTEIHETTASSPWLFYWAYIAHQGNTDLQEAARMFIRIQRDCEVSLEPTSSSFVLSSTVLEPHTQEERPPCDFSSSKDAFSISIETEGEDSKVNGEDMASTFTLPASVSHEETHIAWDIQIEKEGEAPLAVSSVHTRVSPSTLLPLETAMTVLEDSKFRAYLSINIMEAMAFLHQRLREVLPPDHPEALKLRKIATKSSASIPHFTHDDTMSILPADLIFSHENLLQWYKVCEDILTLLTGKKLLHLVHLRRNRKYMQRILGEYKSLEAMCEKPVEAISQLEDRIHLLQQEILSINIKIEEQRQDVLQIKKMMEKDIGELFHTTIHIVGDITRI